MGDSVLVGRLEAPSHGAFRTRGQIGCLRISFLEKDLWLNVYTRSTYHMVQDSVERHEGHVQHTATYPQTDLRQGRSESTVSHLLVEIAITIHHIT
jgi:hypothetical protein